MAGGGVGTGQDNVILSSAFPVDMMAMTSSLQRYGVSHVGAQAFASGQPVASMADRKALASLLSDALAHLRTR